MPALNPDVYFRNGTAVSVVRAAPMTLALSSWVRASVSLTSGMVSERSRAKAKNLKNTTKQLKRF